MRAVYPSHRARRGRTSRALVVGAARGAGMRDPLRPALRTDGPELGRGGGCGTVRHGDAVPRRRVIVTGDGEPGVAVAQVGGDAAPSLVPAPHVPAPFAFPIMLDVR